MIKHIWLDETGASTAEYAILTLAAVGFAGLLLTVLRSPEVKQMLLDLVKSALTVTGNS
jgi:Flp pilus assembly pilin Flp